MLRRALHLVDLQQQLVVFWFVGSWKNESGWWPNNKMSQICAELENKDPIKQRSHARLATRRVTGKQQNSLTDRHTKGDILNYCTFSPPHLPHYCRTKCHLPLSYRVSNISNSGSGVVYYDMFAWRKYHIWTKAPSSCSPMENLSWPALWHVKWEVTDRPSQLSTVHADNEHHHQPTFCLSAMYSPWI